MRNITGYIHVSSKELIELGTKALKSVEKYYDNRIEQIIEKKCKNRWWFQKPLTKEEAISSLDLEFLSEYNWIVGYKNQDEYCNIENVIKAAKDSEEVQLSINFYCEIKEWAESKITN